MLELLLPLLLLLVCLRLASRSQRAWLAAVAYSSGTFLVWWGLAGEPASWVLLVAAVVFLSHWGLFAIAVRWEDTVLWWLAVGVMFLLLSWPLVLSMAFVGQEG
jgi:hypothetical protein